MNKLKGGIVGGFIAAAVLAFAVPASATNYQSCGEDWNETTVPCTVPTTAPATTVTPTTVAPTTTVPKTTVPATTAPATTAPATTIAPTTVPATTAAPTVPTFETVPPPHLADISVSNGCNDFTFIIVRNVPIGTAYSVTLGGVVHLGVTANEVTVATYPIAAGPYTLTYQVTVGSMVGAVKTTLVSDCKPVDAVTPTTAAPAIVQQSAPVPPATAKPAPKAPAGGLPSTGVNLQLLILALVILGAGTGAVVAARRS